MCGIKIKLFIVFRRKDVHANIGNEKKDTIGLFVFQIGVTQSKSILFLNDN